MPAVGPASGVAEPGGCRCGMALSAPTKVELESVRSSRSTGVPGEPGTLTARKAGRACIHSRLPFVCRDGSGICGSPLSMSYRRLNQKWGVMSRGVPVSWQSAIFELQEGFGAQ